MTNDDPLTSVDLLDDGSTLAVGSSRGRVHIYDIRVTTVPLQTLVAHRSPVSRVCFQRNPVVFKVSYFCYNVYLIQMIVMIFHCKSATVISLIRIVL